jgi:hypothetical protein
LARRRATRRCDGTDRPCARRARGRIAGGQWSIQMRWLWPIILGAGFPDGLTCRESLTRISMRFTSEQSTTGTRCFAKASAWKRSLGAQQQRTGLRSS